MSRPAIKSLSRVQIGLEGTRGTAVAATRRLTARSATYRDMIEEDDGSEEMTGSLARTALAPVTVRRWTEFQLECSLDFEQALFAFLSGVKGDVTPVQGALAGTSNAAVSYTSTTMTDTRLTGPNAQVVNRWVGATITADGKTGVVTANTADTFTVASWVGGTPTSESSYAIAGVDYTWTVTPPLTADPEPDTYTIEYSESAPGGDSDDQRCSYGFVTGFTIGGGDNSLSTLSVQAVGQAGEDSAATGALPVIPLDRSPALRLRASVDDTWAELGDTPVLGQIYNTQFVWRDHLRPGWYQGNDDLTFEQYEIGRRVAEVSFDTIVDPDGGLLVTEKAAKAAGSLRYVRLRAVGAPVATGSSLLLQMLLDGAYYHAPDSLAERGSDRDGNMMVRVHLLSAEDTVEAKDVQFTVVNTVSAFPSEE